MTHGREHGRAGRDSTKRGWLPPVAILALGLALGAAACGLPELAPVTVPDPGTDASYVVMVSFDGMRHDFIDRVETPAFDRVAGTGVRAAGLIPTYPSKTFPNHYSIATGLYPSSHGLVDNTFYDPALDALYRISDRAAVRNSRWYFGEPIWVTAESQGVRTASYFWVGTEARVAGVQPSYFKYYDESVPYAARVDTVLNWLSLPGLRRPRLVMLYFDEPDGTAHRMGPDHPDIDAVVRELDRHLGRLLDGIEALAIADQVTVVLVSDHGMARVPRDSVIHLEDHADLDGVRATHNGTQTLLYFGGDTARVEAVFRALDGVPHATVYHRADTPDRWHYDHSRRIGELVVAADPGWVIQPRSRSPWSGGGMHGWDPSYRAMHGIFLATGPGLRRELRIPAFENIHVYPFVAHLLGLEPAPVDGRLEVLEETLLQPAMSP